MGSRPWWRPWLPRSRQDEPASKRGRNLRRFDLVRCRGNPYLKGRLTAIRCFNSIAALRIPSTSLAPLGCRQFIEQRSVGSGWRGSSQKDLPPVEDTMKSIDTTESTTVARSRDSALADRCGEIGINAVAAATHHCWIDQAHRPSSRNNGRPVAQAADRPGEAAGGSWGPCYMLWSPFS
jgi:hypothetical protein